MGVAPGAYPTGRLDFGLARCATSVPPAGADGRSPPAPTKEGDSPLSLQLPARPRARAFATALLTSLAVVAPASAQAAVGIASVGQPRIALAHSQRSGQDAYDYAPSVMYEKGGYTAWWCGTGDLGGGDHIHRARSARLGSGWTQQREVLGGRGGRTFDGVHTCDPDVIKDNFGYTMYYGGLGDTRNPAGEAGDFTEIGVATSRDGITWTRQNGGRAIIGAKNTQFGDAYGAGQPSVVRSGGWYTMVYSSVSRLSRGGTIDRGEYAVRSRDRLFRTQVQERRASGWVALPNRPAGGVLAVARDYKVLADSQHSQNLTLLSQDGVFASVGSDGIRLLSVARLDPVGKLLPVSSPGLREQRAIPRSPWGKVYRSANGRYDMTLMAAMKGASAKSANDPFSWDLAVQPLTLVSR